MTRPPGEAGLRPVIVTVDDDPGVSRAVARDLRRRYGSRNRVVRAESVPGSTRFQARLPVEPENS